MAVKKIKPQGFTLVELLVAIAISSLALIMLTRLFSVSLHSYNAQEQLTDMNQNARYTVRELSDILMQAGADLQLVNLDTLDRDTIIVPDGGGAECSGFIIKINPRGGICQIPAPITTKVCSLEVKDARAFDHADSIQRVPALGSTMPLSYYALLRLNTTQNFIVFSPADSFKRDDAVCSFVKRHYYLSGTNLCFDNDTNVIAENIDSLSILFLDRNGSPTAEWAKMRSVKLLVRVKTGLPDRRYNEYADHCRRVTLTYEFRLRNKVAL
jgi:prepilin-type N-terminal cleavage/methylation domain-containing protein